MGKYHFTITLFWAIALLVTSCSSPPQRIDKSAINKPENTKELRSFEVEIVDLNYEIKRQKERVEEFSQILDERKEAYSVVPSKKSNEKEIAKRDFDLARAKFALEQIRLEYLQLKLKERIAFLELKKATIVSAQSKEPLELAPYENYYRRCSDLVIDAEKDLANQKEKVRTLENGETSENR